MIKYNFKQVVKAKGLSARQLAALAGISPNTAALLVKAETHKDYNVSTEVLDRLCGALGVQLAQLIRYKK